MLATTLAVAACVVPPTCFRRAFGPAHTVPIWAWITVYSVPVAGPLPTGPRLPPRLPSRFLAYEGIELDARGGMTVTRRAWPYSCTKISLVRFGEVERLWQTYLERERPGPLLYELTNPFTGADWYDEGPILEVRFYGSGTGVDLFWDGKLDLPEDLDAAVFGTLELACSESRRARRILHGLSPQVAARLACGASDAAGADGERPEAP